MAAPTSAYFPINFKFRGSNNVEMTVNPAKAQADKATLMARFYLDDVICFQANVGGVLYHGFWGVVLPSGFNYNHHKTTRLLEINGPKPGQVLRTFNDAGLNTLGDVVVNSIITTFANQLKVSLTALSAFYIASGNYGIEFKLNSASVWTRFNFGTSLSQNASISLISKTNTFFEEGNIVNIRGFISNSEGDYVSPTQSYTALGKIMNTDGFYRGSTFTCATTGDVQVSVWMTEADFFALSDLTTTAQTTDIYGYTDDELTDLLPSGWYAALDGNLYKVYQVINGMFTKYETCTPPAPLETFNIYGSENLSSDGFEIFITKSESPNFTVNVVISGRIQEYTGTTPTSNYTDFSITVLANNGGANGTVAITINSSLYNYQIINLSASPSSVGGNTVTFNNLGLEYI